MQEKGYTAKEIIKVLKDALDSYFRPEKSTDNCRQVINLDWTLALVSDNFCEKRGSSDSEDDDSHHRIEIRHTALWLAEEIAHVKLQLYQYAVLVKYTNYALGMMRSMIPDSEKVPILLMQAEAFVHLGMDGKVSESLLEAEWIAPSNRDIQRKIFELEERLASDPAKADIAYDHHTRVERQDCRREELLQYDPRDRM